VAAAERDVRHAQQALASLERREQSAGRKRTGRDSSLRQARRRAQRLLETVERNAKQKQKLVQRLTRQAAEFDQSLRQLNTGPVGGTAQAAVSAEQLRAARAMLGLSQKTMAARLETSVRRLRDLETGRLGSDDSPELMVELTRKLSKLGIEVIPAGLYVGAGGPGLRLKTRRARTDHGSVPQRPRAAESRKKKVLAA